MARWWGQMLLLALTATGLVVWLGGRWNLAYSVHAALHPLLGLIFTVVLAVGMSAHARIDKEAELRSDVSLRRRMAVGPVIILGLIVVASLQLLPGALTFVGLVLPALLYFIWSIVRFLRAELALRPVRKATALATGLIFMGAWTVVVLTGVVMVIGEATGRLRWIVGLHVATSALVVLAHCVHLIASTVYRWRATPAQHPAIRTNLTRAGVGLIVVGALSATAAWAEPERASFSNPATDRTGIQGHLVAGSLDRDAMCATSGCHASIGDMHKGSAHAISPQTKYFRKITEKLVEERGVEGLAHCASCHFPGGLFDEAIPSGAQLASTPGVGCLGCHGLEAVEMAEGDGYHTGRKLTYAVDTDHLDLLQAAVDDPDGWERRAVLANVEAHGRAMRTSILGSDEHCLGCHHIHVPIPPERTLETPGCVTCHMQGQPELTAKGERLNHHFYGSNVSIPALNLDLASVSGIERWLSGAFRHEELPVPWTLLERRYEFPETIVWLRMMVGTVTPPRAGTTLGFEVATDNVAVGKPFPSAPLDLIEVWQETRVTDERGRVLLESGVVAPGESPPDDVPRLGGHLEDDEGNRLLHHEIWRGHEVKGRRIPMSMGIRDPYTVEVPKDAKVLTVESRWLMRDLRTDFREWSLGAGHGVAPTMEVGAVKVDIDLLP